MESRESEPMSREMPVGEQLVAGELPVDPPAEEQLPVLAVRDTVLFPGALLPLSVGRAASVALVESLGENRVIGVVAQIDPRTDVPGPKDLHEVGTVAMIHKISEAWKIPAALLVRPYELKRAA